MAGLGMTVLQPASNLVSYHAEVVSAGGHRALLERWIHDSPRWDVLHAANLEVEGPTAKAITALAQEMGAPLQVIPGDLSPYLPLEGTWDAYLATKKKKFRYKLRHRRELLDQNGKWELRWFESAADTERLLQDIVHIEARSWKAKEGIDIPADARELEYHRALLPFLAKQGALLANVLYIADQAVAYCLCCRDRQWVGNLKTSFDESFAVLSPGAVVIDTSIERAFSLGAREFDFLGNSGSHKLAWSELMRVHADYFLFAPRLKPRVVALLKTLKKRLARPAPASAADRPTAD
jgi:CelD/BcsL family acetyltransferase involved in cellulose biosynthesis